MPNLESGLWTRLVNSKWPKDMVAPTEQEAIAGTRRLYRKATGRPWSGAVEITSGNRHTWIYRGCLRINPASWKGIVHDISHLAHQRLHPGDRPHSSKQAYLERDLTDYVLSHGFLTGALKRSTRSAGPNRDLVAERYLRILAREASWAKKLSRAQNALKKARMDRRGYERRHGDRVAA